MYPFPSLIFHSSHSVPVMLYFHQWDFVLSFFLNYRSFDLTPISLCLAKCDQEWMTLKNRISLHVVYKFVRKNTLKYTFFIISSFLLVRITTRCLELWRPLWTMAELMCWGYSRICSEIGITNAHKLLTAVKYLPPQFLPERNACLFLS